MKNVKDTIEQIHNEFDYASESVLLEAKLILDNAHSQDLSQGRRLNDLGFTNTKKAHSFIKEKTKIELSQEQAGIINDYKNKYPKYKFIFREMVQDICGKYSLICAESKCYKGDIPEKNINEIEQFEKIRQSIKLKTVSISTYGNNTGEVIEDDGICARAYPNIYKKEQRFDKNGKDMPTYFICAPIKDIDISRTDKMAQGYIYDQEKTVPDPIVLCPVPYGYLIVTKWGMEENMEELNDSI